MNEYAWDCREECQSEPYALVTGASGQEYVYDEGCYGAMLADGGPWYDDPSNRPYGMITESGFTVRLT